MPIAPNGSPFSATCDIASIIINDAKLVARLTDGREVAAPLAWYPRLAKATPTQRANWRLVGGGYGVHWPDVDEDISLEMLLKGLPSLEAPTLEDRK